MIVPTHPYFWISVLLSIEYWCLSLMMVLLFVVWVFIFIFINILSWYKDNTEINDDLSYNIYRYTANASISIVVYGLVYSACVILYIFLLDSVMIYGLMYLLILLLIWL